MSGLSVLHDISRALQLQIVSALNSAPDAGFGADETNILLKPPSQGLAATVKAVLYLYHIGIDPYSRNQPRLPDASDPTLFLRPPLPLNLRYIFVPLADDEEGNQLILGRILQYFHDFPTFRPAPGSPLAISRGGAADTIRVRPDLIGFEPLAQLWSALSRPYRLSASFLVDTVAVDSATPAQVTTRVGQTVTATQRKRTEATP